MTEERRGVCVVIGAGDGLGAAIARAFARENLAVVAHAPPAPHRRAGKARRKHPRRGPRGARVRARRPQRGRRGRLLRRRSRRRSGRSRFWSSTSAPTCAFPSSRRRRRSIPRSGRWRPSRAFSPAGRRRGSWAPGAGGRSCSPARPRACAAAPGFSAFAGAKHALRALAQSLARELGPKGDACRPHRHRRGDRRRLHPRPHARRGREARARGDPDPRRDRQELCLAAPPGAERLDLRDGPQAVDGDVVMQPTIEFIFDFASPNAYFAYRALPPILERTGARLDDQPVPARRHLPGDRQQVAVRRLRAGQGQDGVRASGDPALRRKAQARSLHAQPATSRSIR